MAQTSSSAPDVNLHIVLQMCQIWPIANFEIIVSKTLSKCVHTRLLQLIVSLKKQKEKLLVTSCVFPLTKCLGKSTIQNLHYIID